MTFDDGIPSAISATILEFAPQSDERLPVRLRTLARLCTMHDHIIVGKNGRASLKGMKLI